MTEAILLAVCAVLATLVAGLAVAVARLRGRTSYDIAAVRAEQEARRAELELRLAALEAAAGARPSRREEIAGEHAGEYVITRIGDEGADDEALGEVPVERPDARLFADLVLRETVVKAASVAYGVRRGLSPEHRNKMWFEMRREVRRSRKQRRADLKEAQREWKARQRAGLPDDPAEDDAA